MRILCVGGGPGFNPAYLSRAVVGSMACDITAFVGAGDFKSSTDALCQRLKELDAEGPFAVVGHSWGCLLTAVSFGGAHEFANVTHVVLVNPVPFTQSQFWEMTADFRKGIPLRTKALILVHAIRNNGDGAMRALLPYYGIDPADPVVADLGLDLREYRRGSQRLSWPNLDRLTSLLSGWTVIRGTRDTTPEDLLRPVLTCVSSVQSIDRAGHFPMYDAPEAFSRALRSALS